MHPLTWGLDCPGAKEQEEPLMEQMRFAQVNELPGTVRVSMNTVRFMEFDTLKKCLVTECLNGSSAIVIVSQRAAILAHIAPSMTGSDGDQNMRAKMRQVTALFTAYQHLFPQSSVWVVYAVMNNRVALEDQKDIIDDTLRRQPGLNTKQIPYEMVLGSYRTPGHGTVVIDARNGTPEVYIDGQHED